MFVHHFLVPSPRLILCIVAVSAFKFSIRVVRTSSPRERAGCALGDQSAFSLIRPIIPLLDIVLQGHLILPPCHRIFLLGPNSPIPDITHALSCQPRDLPIKELPDGKVGGTLYGLLGRGLGSALNLPDCNEVVRISCNCRR